jgi:hypothetical protein
MVLLLQLIYSCRYNLQSTNLFQERRVAGIIPLLDFYANVSQSKYARAHMPDAVTMPRYSRFTQCEGFTDRQQGPPLPSRKQLQARQ